MILKSIELKNIRSYKHARIDLPEGTVLLSGDIGSGKSSILLAVDFALFGLTKGWISGSGLLRHGEKQGEVELSFEIDNKPITIKRVLKRAQNSIQQDAGYLIINNEKVTGTATELKSRILQILNYPQEFLTKGKSLIYRYTVYTPQEEMKAILTEDEELRLDTLRRVFGIDRYKRIIANSEILTKHLNLKKREILGYITDIEEKRQELKKKTEEKKLLLDELNKIEPVESEINKKFDIAKKEYEKTESLIRELESAKNENKFCETILNAKSETKKRNESQIESLIAGMQKLEQEIKKNEEPEQIKNLIANAEKDIANLENLLHQDNKKMAELSTRQNIARKIKISLQNLNTCPTCYQDVLQTHKSRVFAEQDSIINEADSNILKLQELLREKTKQNEELKSRLKNLNSLLNQIEISQLKTKSLNEKKQLLAKLEHENLQIKKESAELNQKRIALTNKIESLKNAEAGYKQLKKEIDLLIERQKAVAVKKATLAERINTIFESINTLQAELAKKEDARTQAEKLSVLSSWISEKFTEMIGLIEKNVMRKVHSDFNDVFTAWFNILIEDELLNITLDETFNPKILQNGYDSDYTNLSGGEKTACALAYRLALNQVINKMMSSIKTRDLIILDEPTDGFSNEQLERMRLVLDELEIKQVIIVSHESKIESFVEHVIKINKKGHSSTLINP